MTVLHSNEVDFSLQSICMQERRTLNSLDFVCDHFSKKKVASPYILNGKQSRSKSQGTISSFNPDEIKPRKSPMNQLFTILFVMIKSQHYLVGGATGSLSLLVHLLEVWQMIHPYLDCKGGPMDGIILSKSALKQTQNQNA
ncbi:hypothetical protein ACJX0J_017119 [Zea mays]